MHNVIDFYYVIAKIVIIPEPAKLFHNFFEIRREGKIVNSE
jgi:hypothetical protein